MKLWPPGGLHMVGGSAACEAGVPRLAVARPGGGQLAQHLQQVEYSPKSHAAWKSTFLNTNIQKMMYWKKSQLRDKLKFWNNSTTTTTKNIYQAQTHPILRFARSALSFII